MLILLRVIASVILVVILLDIFILGNGKWHDHKLAYSIVYIGGLIAIYWLAKRNISRENGERHLVRLLNSLVWEASRYL